MAQQNLKDESFNHWMLYIYMKNMDMHKYRTLLSKLQSDFSMEQDNYSKELLHAINQLSNHQYKNHSKKKKKPNHNNKNQEEIKKNKENGATGALFAQKNKGNRFCLCCGDKNHVSTDCPKKDNILKNQ